MKNTSTTLAASLLFGYFTLLTDVEACSRILWNDNNFAVLVGRTMDWPESTRPIPTVFPRGMSRNGGVIGSEIAVEVNGAKWTSKYGSLVTTIYDMGTIDGFNEKGLAGHGLYLNATHFGERDVNKAGIYAGLSLQYLLDNAANVKEAIALLEDVQIIKITAEGHDSNVHLAIEDASGDSAIIALSNTWMGSR